MLTRLAAPPCVVKVAGQSIVGRPADSRRAAQIGHRRQSGHRREVHRLHSQTTVATWRTFLANHLGQIAAADFLVVPTATCRLLFVLVILAHERRRVVHLAVTDHPTAAWTAQQLREAFPWNEVPRYLIRDRDTSFHAWATTATAMEICEVVTAPRSPWQNAYAERLIGSIRRECLDHVIVWHARGLRRVLNTYVEYHQLSRTHLSLDKDTPIHRPIMAHGDGRIVAIPQVGGLHHRYERRAA
jgi:putative transposase